jgi:predicted nucleic acid-binding protein
VSVVVDASTALKWLLVEDASDRAYELIGSELLIAPDFLFLECMNVLALRVQRGLWRSIDAEQAFGLLTSIPMRVVPSQLHVGEAGRLATHLPRQTVYDCLYLAVAMAEGAVMVTADQRFAEAVQQEPAYASAIRLL